MIVIFIDNIENFLSFLDKRIMDQVFYEFKEIKDETDLSKEIKIEIILHYLAKIGDTLILYETKQKFLKYKSKPNSIKIPLIPPNIRIQSGK